MAIRVMMMDEETQRYLEFLLKARLRQMEDLEELPYAHKLGLAIREIQNLPEPGDVGEPYVAEDGMTTIPIQGPLEVGVHGEDIEALVRGAEGTA